MKCYKFDIIKQTLTISASFAAAMNNPESDEYKLVCKLQRDFRKLVIVRKTHATPKRYKNSDGTITVRNKNRELTYDRMEDFMLSLPDGDPYLDAYFDLRDKAKAMSASPYTVVSKWFMRQFPKYRENPLLYLNYSPAIYDFSAILEKAAKKPAVIETESEQKTA